MLFQFDWFSLLCITDVNTRWRAIKGVIFVCLDAAAHCVEKTRRFTNCIPWYDSEMTSLAKKREHVHLKLKYKQKRLSKLVKEAHIAECYANIFSAIKVKETYREAKNLCKRQLREKKSVFQ
jgi:hypothetical protein